MPLLTRMVGTPLTIDLDFGSMTSLTSRTSELVMNEQDGAPLGVLQTFSIGADGTVTGAYSNGRTKPLAQVAVATFDNPQGLVDNGGNQFVAGANSGVAIVSTPLSFGAGAIRSGALELSNVDLSEEFINMIISSTGFSAFAFFGFSSFWSPIAVILRMVWSWRWPFLRR